jgi:hypothetical protein
MSLLPKRKNSTWDMANFTAVYDASATKQAQKSTYNPSRLDAVHSDLSGKPLSTSP